MAAQKQLVVVLGYSQNGGTSFSTKTFLCADHRIFVDTEIVHEHKLVQNRRIIQYTVSRLYVDLHIDFRNFLPATDTDESAWLFLQKWLGGKIKRISTNGVSAWGFNDFNSLTNTAYVTLRGKEERDVPNSDVRSVIINLQSQDEYIVT